MYFHYMYFTLNDDFSVNDTVDRMVVPEKQKDNDDDSNHHKKEGSHSRSYFCRRKIRSIGQLLGLWSI